MTFTEQEKTALEKLARELVKSDLADGEHQPSLAIFCGSVEGLVAALKRSADHLTGNADGLREELTREKPDRIALANWLQKIYRYRELVSCDAAALLVFAGTMKDELDELALAPKSAGRPSTGAEEERS